MTDETVTTALRLIKEALFTFGAEGDECIQKLVSVQASFGATEIFGAFYRGLTGHAEALPAAAYQLGCIAERLNAARRAESGLNVGPFDTPAVQAALTNAMKRLN